VALEGRLVVEHMGVKVDLERSWWLGRSGWSLLLDEDSSEFEVVVVAGSTKRQRMTSSVEGSISTRPNVKKK
jgi:hypothetical protein